MNRDTLIAELLGERLSPSSGTRRNAATVLIDLCRDGMSDAEIMATLDRAARHMFPELLREARAIATAHGVRAATIMEFEKEMAVGVWRSTGSNGHRTDGI